VIGGDEDFEPGIEEETLLLPKCRAVHEFGRGLLLGGKKGQDVDFSGSWGWIGVISNATRTE